MGYKPEWKTIGILGGMGPEATAEFYRRIIRICQRDYNAKYDSDFPPIFIYNLPLPDMIEKNESKEQITAMMEEGICKLKFAGCDFVAVPCNTAFCFVDSSKTEIPVVNIVEEVYLEAKRRNYSRVGVLSTLNTTSNRLYEDVFDGIEIMNPSEAEQKEVNDIVLRVLAGNKTQKDRKYIGSVCRKLERSGATAIVLGCTELPLLISQKDCGIKLLDTLQILAEATIEKARLPTKSLRGVANARGESDGI